MIPVIQVVVLALLGWNQQKSVKLLLVILTENSLRHHPEFLLPQNLCYVSLQMEDRRRDRTQTNTSLMEDHDIEKEITLNPATLLPDSDPAAPLHHCLKVISQTCLAWPGLTDVPLLEPNEIFFTDGSSYVRDGVRYAGAAVVSQTGEVRWAQALPRGSSAQKAELIALTQALRIGKDKAINVYTDSRYAFATVHVHGEIYKNRGLLTSEGRAIKNKKSSLS